MTGENEQPSAESLFADYIARLEAGEGLDFDAWVASNAGHATELRLLHSDWKSLGVDVGSRVEGELSFFRGREGTREAAAPGFQVGQFIGDFELVAFIDKGGMGEVWEAKQTGLGDRRVAIKFVRPERVSERQVALFQREARAGGRLNHPGIVGVHASGESDGIAWIAMELVAGCWTLRDFVDEMARKDEVPAGYDRHAARFAAEIADAMQTAHEAGVIHRDLKPQNVLVTGDDHPKVTDFGLARITDETALSATGEFAGTYLYMSPEQVTAKRMGIDHRTDVFSLGVLLYELLALRRPFQGDTTHQIAAQIVTQDPPDLESIRSRIPHALVVIVGKALEKDPNRRYATMADFAADLRRFLAAEPVQARRPSVWARSVRWMKRNPTTSAVGGVVITALVLISALLVKYARVSSDLFVQKGNLESLNVELADSAERERQRAEEVLSLSAFQTLEELRQSADELWPPNSENIGPYEDWIGAADEVVARLDEFAEQLRRFEARASGTVGAARVFDDPRDRWWYGQLVKLVEEIEALSASETGLASVSPNAVSEEHGWSVPRRLAFARRLRDGLAPGGEWGSRWQTAAAEILAHTAYGGLELAPQAGLVPIGVDPSSGLWEFWHVATGVEPSRDELGQLVVTEEMGVVLVLIPGGTFWMGAQPIAGQPNHDPAAMADEGPVRSIQLAPYFLSKYELTQAQWKRLTGWNHSWVGPDGTWSANLTRDGIPATGTSPVTDVSWFDCVHWLPRVGLALPSEAQWENACRAGTQSPWWSGSERESLIGVANLLDRFVQESGALAVDEVEEWLDDGATTHAPVGTYRANPYGLHEVHGNVGEWCFDAYDPDSYARSENDDGEPAEEGASRVSRGGSFSVPAIPARSSYRDDDPPRFTDVNLGVRPGRAISD